MGFRHLLLVDFDSEAWPKLRRAVLQGGHDVSFLGLPSAERERRKTREEAEAWKRPVVGCVDDTV